MHKQFLTEAAEQFLGPESAAKMAADMNLPTFILAGPLKMLRAKLVALTEEEAEKILESLFELIDGFRVRLLERGKEHDNDNGVSDASPPAR